jgi:hypothetical protein
MHIEFAFGSFFHLFVSSNDDCRIRKRKLVAQFEVKILLASHQNFIKLTLKNLSRQVNYKLASMT